jgi:UPF0716 protein FxsA
MYLFAAFVIIPILEIALLIRVGGWIGVWETVGLVVLTAIVGTALLRAQGFQILARAEATMARGGFPARELFDGICVLIAGVLLLTPGFVTDAVGLALLVPGLRAVVGRGIWRAMSRSGTVRTHLHFEAGYETEGDANGPDVKGEILEGEYTEVRDEPPGDEHDGTKR